MEKALLKIVDHYFRTTSQQLFHMHLSSTHVGHLFLFFNIIFQFFLPSFNFIHVGHLSSSIVKSNLI